MHFLKLDINLLVTLDALLTDPHVTRAAERLRISQPTVSGSLARLREYFADELIVQVGRRMELTPFAKDLREPLSDLMRRTEKLLSTRASFDPLTSERCFTITCSDYVWATLVREIMPRLAVEAPYIELSYAGTAQDFADRRIDLLIVPDRFALPDYPSELLFKDSYVCVAWSSNKSVGTTLSEEEYFSHRHVVAYSPRPTLIADWLFNNYGRTCKVAARVPNFTLVPQSIVGTNYIATIPLRMATYYAQYIPLRIIEAPLSFPLLVDVLQWHIYQEADSGLTWFRDMIIRSSRNFLST